ncbi:Protein phosphatase 2C 2 [Physocladia obscura]|uniref:protein-serine/threonine phosphatase n=1 Tax=Physocladia obscura TaxID=109957 RepID=A0AAD5SX79_9FUNG|nr:Protein phosphatase 2C 2 [Physocladia obscura]
MGQTLSEPITDKHTTTGQDARFRFAASSMQGWRISMEDAHATILNLDHPGQTDSQQINAANQQTNANHESVDKRFSFFAVYDGHGGSAVAKYSGTHLHNKIVQDPAFVKKDYRAAIKNAFLLIDVSLKTSPEYLADPAGCTAITCLITDDLTVYCGNAGDSRAVLSSNGDAVPLSFDHKPTNPDESARIVAGGGYVEYGRVNGNLALSRAIGDFEFKQNPVLPPEEQIVTVNPDIESRTLVPKQDDFIVLACDGNVDLLSLSTLAHTFLQLDTFAKSIYDKTTTGIWDCMSNDQVVDFVMSRIAEGHTLADTSELIMEYCLAGDSDVGGVGCDNMTVIIVAILGDGKKIALTYEEWVEQIKARWAAKEKKSQFPVKETRGVIGGGADTRGGSSRGLALVDDD